MVSNNCRLAGCEITTCACPQGRWSTQQNTSIAGIHTIQTDSLTLMRAVKCFQRTALMTPSGAWEKTQSFGDRNCVKHPLPHTAGGSNKTQIPLLNRYFVKHFVPKSARSDAQQHL